MSDFNSSLPVRTEHNGDVVAFLADGTINTQLLGIDASGRVTIKLNDGLGNAINSQSISASQWLQVVTPSEGPAAPGTAASFSVLAGGIYNLTPETLASGQQSALQLDANGRLLVDTTLSEDQNYGVVGATTLRTAAQVGNATGAADFNFGTVGAQTLRVAAEPGNATGIADFNNGATGAQTLRVAANLAVGGASVSGTNPVPVAITGVGGTPINDYATSAALAANATVNHDYAITASKTFSGRFFWASGSGMIKAEVQISPDGSTFTTKWVGFNSTAEPNINIQLDNLIITETGAGSKIRIIITNRDKQAQDVYSTISGTEA